MRVCAGGQLHQGVDGDLEEQGWGLWRKGIPHPGDDRDLGLNASPSLPTLGPAPLSGVSLSRKWRYCLLEPSVRA